jgi:hypothetical protein
MVIVMNFVMSLRNYEKSLGMWAGFTAGRLAESASRYDSRFNEILIAGYSREPVRVRVRPAFELISYKIHRIHVETYFLTLLFPRYYLIGR